MTAPATAWKPPADLDPECLELCRALNAMPGIMTTGSCCGHGRGPYRIWIHPQSLDALPGVCYWLDRCHTGLSGWRMVVYTDCSADHATFMIEGPEGASAESEQIAAMMKSATEDGSGG